MLRQREAKSCLEDALEVNLQNSGNFPWELTGVRLNLQNCESGYNRELKCSLKPSSSIFLAQTTRTNPNSLEFLCCKVNSSIPCTYSLENLTNDKTKHCIQAAEYIINSSFQAGESDVLNVS